MHPSCFNLLFITHLAAFAPPYVSPTPSSPLLSPFVPSSPLLSFVLIFSLHLSPPLSSPLHPPSLSLLPSLTQTCRMSGGAWPWNDPCSPWGCKCYRELLVIWQKFCTVYRIASRRLVAFFCVSADKKTDNDRQTQLITLPLVHVCGVVIGCCIY